MTRIAGLLGGCLVVLTVLLFPLLPAPPTLAQTKQLKVVTTISPIADLVKNVGGDRVSVTSIVPLGEGPEDYDPTPADAKSVSQARVYFVNGHGLEEYLDKLVEAAGRNKPEVVTLSDGLLALGSFGQDAEQGGNPHLWLSPQNAIAYVDVIQSTLGRLDSSNASYYANNARNYSGRLYDLDRSISAQWETVPAEQRIIVGTHDAYPYYCYRYNLLCLAVISANPGSDPTAQEYAALVQLIKSYQVKAVFGETGFSDRFISQLAGDTGATYVTNLYTDTLSEGAPADTYISMMKYNTDQMIAALR